MNQKLKMPNRPKTTVILAMTADGKIADEHRSAARFGSTADQTHLEQQVSLVDGVLFGAGTLRAYGTTLSITNPQLIEIRQQKGQTIQPVQIVVSASGNLDPQSRFFKQPVPHWLLTTETGAKFWQQQTTVLHHDEMIEIDAKTRKRGNTQNTVFSDEQIIPQAHNSQKGRFERLLIIENSAAERSQIDWLAAFDRLQQLGLKKLAILGGGELVASLVALDLIDELWLTVCPLILGGRNAPTPVEGIGLTQEEGKRLRLLEVKQINEEIFLHYQVVRE